MPVFVARTDGIKQFGAMLNEEKTILERSHIAHNAASSSVVSALFGAIGGHFVRSYTHAHDVHSETMTRLTAAFGAASKTAQLTASAFESSELENTESLQDLHTSNSLSQGDDND